MRPLISCWRTIISPLCKNDPSSTVQEYPLTGEPLNRPAKISLFSNANLLRDLHKRLPLSLPSFFSSPLLSLSPLPLHSPLAKNKACSLSPTPTPTPTPIHSLPTPIHTPLFQILLHSPLFMSPSLPMRGWRCATEASSGEGSGRLRRE